MDPILGQICLFGFNFVPSGWAACNGQLLSIAQNTALFSLLGTTYGGDGRTTFALPDLRGRVPMGQGQGPGLSNRNIGEASGQETVTLTVPQMPMHNHQLSVSNVEGTTGVSAGATLAAHVDDNRNVTPPYIMQSPNTALNPAMIGMNGGNQPHSNMQPYLVMNYCIAIQGIFPSRS